MKTDFKHSRTLDERLFTLAEAAIKLNMSAKHLMSHVTAGTLRFINIAGPRAKRYRYRFTSANLLTFIENQKLRLVPKEVTCPFIKAKKAHTTAMTLSSTISVFSDLQKPGTKKMPTRSNAN